MYVVRHLVDLKNEGRAFANLLLRRITGSAALLLQYLLSEFGDINARAGMYVPRPRSNFLPDVNDPLHLVR